MIEALLVQDSGVPVVDVHLVFDGFIAMLVGTTILEVPFVIVVAAGTGVGVRCAAKLATPEDQRILEKVTSLVVGQESGNRYVGFRAVVGEGGLDITVLIPTAVAQFDEPHSRFCETSIKQALATEAIGRVFVDSVEPKCFFRFGGEVHHAGDGILHTKCELEVFNSSITQGDCVDFQQQL